MNVEAALPKGRKLLALALRNPAGLRFAQLCALAEACGFNLARVSGSHHIYTHALLRSSINLQDVGGMAKAYQVRQLLKIVEAHDLLGDITS